MDERMTGRAESERRAEPFTQFSEVLEKFVSGALLLSEVQERTRARVSVESDPTTWVSSTRRELDRFIMRIGEQKVPDDIAKKFKWGAETVEQEYMVKVAHEYAHVVQDMFDQHLLRWLDGADEVPQEAIPYIQLYATLSTISSLHGLSQMHVYHEQSETTGNLSVSVYEDMAETIGSYLLGNEYFLYRIKNAHGKITHEQAEKLVTQVTAVVSHWQHTTGVSS